MTTVRVFAPAKVNLTLHVTGQRPDGYHLLDSLVAFAPFGDVLTLRSAADWSLRVDGPEGGGVPAGDSNLAMLAAKLGVGPCEIALSKHLPAASGIGGGSSDAAAAVRGRVALGAAIPGTDALLGLGADVPMCLVPSPCRARGIGEDLTPVDLPDLPAVLVNPRRAVATPEVFRALASRSNPAMDAALPAFRDRAHVIDWLAGQRNDLEAPAMAVQPIIEDVLRALRDNTGCALARMSGSGATCFGLFASEAAAAAAAAALVAEHPEWWVAEGALGDQSARSAPRQLSPAG